MASRIRLFDIIGGQVLPTEHCYTIASLKNILEEYGENAGRIMAYLHYMTSMNGQDNPFADLPEEEKQEVITRQICPEIDTDSVVIKDALEVVLKMYESATYTVYKGFKMMMERMGRYLQTHDLTSGIDGNWKDVISAAKSYPELKNAFKEAYKEHLDEIESEKVRGGIKLSYDEDDDDDLDI